MENLWENLWKNVGTFWKKKSGKILENKGKIMEKIRKNVGKFGKMF